MSPRRRGGERDEDHVVGDNTKLIEWATEIYGVLHAGYMAVDTERNLEEAIEAAPHLLFDHTVEFVARQHIITTGRGDRHVVDLVYYDPVRAELIVAELKRGVLRPEHEAQLLRYFAVVPESPLLRRYLGRGMAVRGVLATVTPCDYRSGTEAIEVKIVDERAVIEVLGLLRQQRWPGDGRQ